MAAVGVMLFIGWIRPRSELEITASRVSVKSPVDMTPWSHAKTASWAIMGITVFNIYIPFWDFRIAIIQMDLTDISKLGDWNPPKSWLKISTLDVHTGGEPLRIIADGFPALEGTTVLEKGPMSVNITTIFVPP